MVITASRRSRVPVQVVGDGKGVVKAFGERECSVQRRHQKVVEESPSPFVDEELRKALCTAAENLCAAASYRSAGIYIDPTRDMSQYSDIVTRY